MKRRKYNDDDAFDEFGILKNQRSIKVPMFCMDAAQTAVRQHFTQVHDGTNKQRLVTDASRHRPGYRFGDGIDRSAADEARRQWISDMQDAWRNPVNDGAPKVKAQEPDEDEEDRDDDEDTSDSRSVTQRMSLPRG